MPDGSDNQVHQLRERVAQLEQQLQETRKREALSTLVGQAVEQLPLVLWVVDSDLRYTLSTGGGLSSLGITPGEAVGLRLDEAVPVSERVLKLHRRALAGDVVRYEDQVSGRWFEAVLQPIRDVSGDVTACAGMAVDVTDRWQAQQRLEQLTQQLEREVMRRTAEARDQTDRLERLLDAIVEGVVMTDAEGEVVHLNRAGRQIVGRATEGMRPAEYAVQYIIRDERGEFLPMDRTPLGRALQGKPAPLQLFQTQWAGESRVQWLEATGVTLRNPAGQITGAVSVFRDVTAQRQQRRQMLLLDSAMSQVQEAVLITDADLDRPGPRIVFCNNAFTQMSGYDRDEIIGRNPRILQGQRTDRPVLDSLKSALQRGERWEGETTNYRKDGTPYLVEWDVTPVRDAQDEVTHFISIQRDITRRRAAEAALREQEAALAHATRVQLMGQMTSAMAHELSQPLQVVVTYSGSVWATLEQRGVLDEELRELLTQVREQGAWAGNVLKGLKRFAERRDVEKRWSDVLELTRQAAAMCGPVARKQRVRLELDLPPKRTMHWCDPVQLQQVVVNLLHNAIEATPRDGGSARSVQIRVRKQPEQLRISVVDGGEGLSAEARRRMFEWYFTTKKHGTGMGLAICRSIVEAHGGRVWAEDGRPRGTRLEVSLPIGRGDRI